MKKFHIEIYESGWKTIEVMAESNEDAEKRYYDDDEGREIYSKIIDYDYEINEVK